MVVDLETEKLNYWHESYQLWESQVKGFLLSTNEFMALSKDGINLLSLGNSAGRVIKDKDGLERFIHSLGSCNYLKIEKDNHLKFACQFYDDRQIWIQDQFEDKTGETQFTNIYKIKVSEITLRELLLVQSIYTCRTATKIS